jgi:hypothetical protein
MPQLSLRDKTPAGRAKLADNFPTYSRKLARLTRFADDFIITGKSHLIFLPSMAREA